MLGTVFYGFYLFQLLLLFQSAQSAVMYAHHCGQRWLQATRSKSGRRKESTLAGNQLSGYVLTLLIWSFTFLWMICGDYCFFTKACLLMHMPTLNQLLSVFRNGKLHVFITMKCILYLLHYYLSAQVIPHPLLCQCSKISTPLSLLLNANWCSDCLLDLCL